MAPGKGDQRDVEPAEPVATTQSLTELLRLPVGPVDIGALDTRGTPGFPGTKADALALTQALAPELSDLQGVKIKAFKAPTEDERKQPYLWRIERELPPPGVIGIFDRSHYEDLLVVRVRKLVEESVWSARYDEINAWEKELLDAGTILIKCFLHISSAEQKDRLLARLNDPTKHWKYNPGDIEERARWFAYVEAYQAVLERCSTQLAPWFVIPADRKWYRNWAVAQLLLEHLRALKLEWPAADFDVETEKKRLAAT